MPVLNAAARISLDPEKQDNLRVHDVRPEQYATVIRELVRHENDVTNHRIMWLLIVQGLLVNAYVGVRQDAASAAGLELAGILVTLSAFVMLYKGYQARGYLHFLGRLAKRGELLEEFLAIDGWPKNRIRDWRSTFWVCRWLQQPGDVLEPYLFLPSLIISGWICLLLRRRILLATPLTVLIAIFLTTLLLFGLCVVWVRLQDRLQDRH